MEVLADWREARHAGRLSDRLATTLGVLERATAADGATLEAAVAEALDAGVEPGALASAGYINLGFNVINRVADAVGVRLPDAPALRVTATVLLTLGYRPLSGRWFGLVPRIGSEIDPFAPLVRELGDTVLTGPAALSTPARQALRDGTAAGPLGDFGRQVADRAWTVTAAGVGALRRGGHSDDEIFEAAIAAAVGAGMRRLTPLLRLL